MVRFPRHRAGPFALGIRNRSRSWKAGAASLAIFANLCSLRPCTFPSLPNWRPRLNARGQANRMELNGTGKSDEQKEAKPRRTPRSGNACRFHDDGSFQIGLDSPIDRRSRPTVNLLDKGVSPQAHPFLSASMLRLQSILDCQATSCPWNQSRPDGVRGKRKQRQTML